MSELQVYKAKLNDAIASLLAEKGSHYFYALTLTMFPIYLDEELLEEEGALAQITGDKIILSKEFFDVDPAEQKHTLCHEVLHFLMGHLRWANDEDDALAIALDMVVNSKLVDDGFPRFDDLWYLDDLTDMMPLKELKKMSEIEIRDLVWQKYFKNRKGGSGGFGKRITEHGKGRGGQKIPPQRRKRRRKRNLKKLKDGSFDSRNYFDNLQMLKETLEKMVKIAGEDAGCFKEILGIEIKRPTWKIKLRRLLASYLSKRSKLDLTREHRKTKDYFARRSIPQLKQVIVSIDTSGSMRPKEISEAVGLILGYCRARCFKRIKLVQWDAVVHEVKDIKATIRELEVKGRGGTRLTPFLKWLSSQKIPSVVFIASDWYLFDENDAKRILRDLEQKHQIIGITTSDRDPLTSVKVKIQ